MNRISSVIVVGGIASTLALISSALSAQTLVTTPAVPVTVQNFAQAECDKYFAANVKQGGFGKFVHVRAPTPIDKQDVVGMNRDTLYSSVVIDLDAGPATITLPDTHKRFMSLLIVNEEAYSPAVVYAPGRFTFTRGEVGTRYMMAVVRTLVDPRNPTDVQAVNTLQDQIQVEQPASGSFSIANWDLESQKAIRDALIVLSGHLGENTPPRFGLKDEVDPVMHFIVTAAGWGGNPEAAAVYTNVYPRANDGNTVHRLTVKDVPVDGFWSISVYDKGRLFVKNSLDSYSVNNVTATKGADESVTVQFGGCLRDTPNCIPTPPNWNYIVREYRPRKPILDGSWKFPEAQPVTH